MDSQMADKRADKRAALMDMKRAEISVEKMVVQRVACLAEMTAATTVA